MDLHEQRPRPAPWPQLRQTAKHKWAVPFVALEWFWDLLAYRLSNWKFLHVVNYLRSFGIIVAVAFYFSESGDRLKQKHYQAWQVINTAQGKGGNGGRLDALQELNEDRVPLVGVDVSGAFLQGLHLEKANLARANLNSADVRNAVLPSIDFSDANLRSANFRDSNCRGASFRGATLDDTDFSGADLSGADLQRRLAGKRRLAQRRPARHRLGAHREHQRSKYRREQKYAGRICCVGVEKWGGADNVRKSLTRGAGTGPDWRFLARHDRQNDPRSVFCLRINPNMPGAHVR